MTQQTILTVGPGQQFATINAAIAAADAMGGNADIRVAAGTYTNDGGYLWDGINNVTIEGVGGTAKIVDPTYNAGGKAAIVTGGQNILLENLDISGVTVPDGNGAGVRYDQGTLTLDNVSLHGNQDGILGAADPNGSITIQNSNIYGNGAGDGYTHDIYIGDVARFALIDSYVHDANGGHEVKSRAETTFLDANVIADNSADASYTVDLPNGGNAILSDNVIEQGPNSPNHTIIAYGEEGNLHASTSIDFDNNTVINDNPSGAGPLLNNDGGTVTGSGNTAWNVTNLGAGVDPANVAALSTRPSLAADESAILEDIALNAPKSVVLSPTITVATGVPYTGVRLSGTSAPGSTVTITDGQGGTAQVLGTATASSTGAWNFLSTYASGQFNITTVHRYSASAVDGAGDTGAMPGALILADYGKDVLTATPGVADVFAIMSFLGSDVINGFQTASAAGATHDVLDFSGRGLSSFGQVQAIMSGSSSTVFTLAGGKTVTLAGVAPSTLGAADIRLS